MGTPQFAATILEALLAFDGAEVIAVYTQPDRPAGRGKKLKASEVKELAVQKNLPLHQPVNFAAAEDVATLAAYNPDYLVVAAYGIILPQSVLDIPSQMPINVHASLLPKYRGAAPIQRAIMEGEVVTGVTIMRMEAGLDTGPMLMQQAMGIDINETASQLHDELARAGGDLLIDCLARLANNAVRQMPQNDALASYASRLTKQEGQVDFSRPVKEVHAHIRGVTEWPGAYAALERAGQESVIVRLSPGIYPFSPPFAENTAPTEALDAHVGLNTIAPSNSSDSPDSCADSGSIDSDCSATPDSPVTSATFNFPDFPCLLNVPDSLNLPCSPPPGSIGGVHDNALLVACADGWYAFTRLRPAGKKDMDGASFYNGYIANSSDGIFR